MTALSSSKSSASKTTSQSRRRRRPGIEQDLRIFRHFTDLLPRFIEDVPFVAGEE